MAPRYSMANLLLLLATIVYALDRVPAEAGIRGIARPALAAMGVVAAVVAIQLVVSTDNGLNRAEMSQTSMVLGDRLIVNLGQIPPAEVLCYAIAGIETYTGEVGDNGAVVEAQQDHLSELSPGANQTYKAEGLPRLSACPSR